MIGLAPEIVWGIFPRLLGIVYFVAIGSLYRQVLPFAGANGLRPIHKHLDKIHEDYPSWKRFVYFPTLFWLNDGDNFLRLIVGIGTAAGLLALIGGAITSISLFVCWACFLSLDMAFSLAYPWDSLLMEAGFLAIFLPPVQVLPHIESSASTLPIVVFAYNFLIFRLMFGFGKFKFLGTNRKERLYLKPFLINQPVPSPLGWLASHLPGWVAMIALGYLFLVEMILPFLIFLGGGFRLISSLGIIGLMIGIQLMGSFGFFNLLVICLCVTLLDTQASLLGQIQSILTTLPQSPVVSTILLIWAVGALIYLPFNSWCTQAWVYWPSIVFVKPLWLRRVIAFYRGFAPFRF
ncbi:MAG: lipase maturation factor family protein, partial [Chloroflexota bacterium]